jgi:hypothetical protein
LANLTSNFTPFPMAFCNADGSISNYYAVGVPSADMLLLLWWTMCFVMWEMLWVIRVARFQRSVLHSCMDTNISHSDNSIIPILILYVISKLIAPQSPCSCKCYFFTNHSYFNFNSEPAYPALALCHNLKDLPATCSNTSQQHWTSLPAFSASNSCCHHRKRVVSWL